MCLNPRRSSSKERPLQQASAKSQCRVESCSGTPNLEGDRQADLTVHFGRSYSRTEQGRAELAVPYPSLLSLLSSIPLTLLSGPRDSRISFQEPAYIRTSANHDEIIGGTKHPRGVRPLIFAVKATVSNRHHRHRILRPQPNLP